MDQTAARSSTRRPVVFRDGLGRRCRVPDQSGNEKLEILCLRSELTVSEQFEPALRERVARLASFQSANFSRLKTVERLRDQTSTLVLVSETTHGMRLGDLITIAERRGFGLDGSAAWCLARQLVVRYRHASRGSRGRRARRHRRRTNRHHARCAAGRGRARARQRIEARAAVARAVLERAARGLPARRGGRAAGSSIGHHADRRRHAVAAARTRAQRRRVPVAVVDARRRRDHTVSARPSGRRCARGCSVRFSSKAASRSRRPSRPALCSTKRWSRVTARSRPPTSQRSWRVARNRVMPFARVCRWKHTLMSWRPHQHQSGAGHAAKGTATLEALVEAPAPQPVNATPAPAKEIDADQPGRCLVVTPAIATANPALQFPSEISVEPTPAAAGEKQENKKDASDSVNHSPSGSAGLFGLVTAADEPAAAPGSKLWQRAAAAVVLLTVISGAGWAAASHYFDVSADNARRAACEHRHPAVAAVRIGRHAKRLALDGQ